MKKINTLMGIFLMVNMLMLTKAQSPGGVTGTAAWYKGDAGLSSTAWTDQSANGYNLLRTSSPAGSYFINFNPVASFTGVTANRFTNTSTKTSWPVSTAGNTYYYVAKDNLGSNADRAVYGMGPNWFTGIHSGRDGAGPIATSNRADFATSSASVTSPDWNLTQPNVGLNLVRSGYTGTQFYTSAQGGPEVTGAIASQANVTTNTFSIGATPDNILFWNGDVAEVIVYPGKHTATDYNKVESYLALKYGISKSGNYIASNGTTNYWNAAANAGYLNNITGIGKDDGSILYQKQSMSGNSGQQILIGLTGMANTNASNSGTLTDQQFLVVGDNGLAKTPSAPISSIPGVNYRFGAVWKVQNTASVGTVRIMWPQGLNNLKLVQNSSDPTFAASNTVTDMSANTQTINAVVYNYADVSIADGQYFTFAAYVIAPGGVVSNLRVWIKADDNPNGNTTDNVAITTWPNKTLIGGNFVGGAASPNTVALQTTGPLYRNSSAMNINFNPVAQSTSSSGLGMQNAFTSTGDDYTMIALNKNPTVSGFRNMFHFHGGANLNATSGGNEWFGALANLPIAWPSAAGSASYTANIPAVTTFSATGTGTIAYQVNSVSKGSGSSLSKSGTDLLIGVDGDGGLDDGIDIIMPENIMYNSVLGSTDYNKVVSYLAIKYGVTLGTFVSPVNYTSTNGTTVWSTAASSYHTNVIGIARDDAEALHQRISKSQDAVGDIITISTNNDFTNANSSTNHTDIVNDQFYFITGNNGAATTYNAQNIMNRRWKVQSTGTAQNLYIKTSDIQATYLIYADDAAMTTNVVNIPLTSSATPGIQIPNGKFFTFAKFAYCTKDPNPAPATNFTKIGITVQAKQNGWPENIPNGAVALESKTKGFVITRSQSSLIADPREGMLIYDTVDNCVKLYNGTSWNCVVRSCN
ncbi:hypothetical protein HHL23_02745 [Chryseobacterium sp. RP-3-3]|uniref:DUF8202 domain-containing protein n=1 Tax=Chryseobacterium antibioticum TaxID=2728847 RepID=A0A7Y0AK87_9FLAO|nr:hypothetical protein [Chryseobacterium antibioticum]NML68717.1 hypothetical protein [Chryseobacterium antibioticum]